MKDWREYIEQKFVPEEEFIFQEKHKETNFYGHKKIMSTIIITHPKTNNWFKFDNFFGEWEYLWKVKFGNPRTKCSPSYTEDDAGIDVSIDEVVLDLNKFLKPAFNGWSIIEYYLFGEYNRSIYYSNINFQGKGEWDYTRKDWYDRFGINYLLLKLRIHSYVKRVVIDPINT